MRTVLMSLSVGGQRSEKFYPFEGVGEDKNGIPFHPNGENGTSCRGEAARQGDPRTPLPGRPGSTLGRSRPERRAEPARAERMEFHFIQTGRMERHVEERQRGKVIRGRRCRAARDRHWAGHGQNGAPNRPARSGTAGEEWAVALCSTRRPR